MSFTDILKKIFGDTATRDRKALEPIAKQIEDLRPELEKLTNDQLRGKIDEVRADIAAAIADDEKAIAEKKEEIEKLPFDKRQPLWDEIAAHEKSILDILEERLNHHLPVVFATVRETAARFAHNETIEVTATQLDRDLAAQGRDFVSIDGDKALWKNHWMAGGNAMTRDMIH